MLGVSWITLLVITSRFAGSYCATSHEDAFLRSCNLDAVAGGVAAGDGGSKALSGFLFRKLGSHSLVTTAHGDACGPI